MSGFNNINNANSTNETGEADTNPLIWEPNSDIRLLIKRAECEINQGTRIIEQTDERIRTALATASVYNMMLTCMEMKQLVILGPAAAGWGNLLKRIKGESTGQHEWDVMIQSLSRAVKSMILLIRDYVKNYNCDIKSILRFDKNKLLGGEKTMWTVINPDAASDEEKNLLFKDTDEMGKWFKCLGEDTDIDDSKPTGFGIEKPEEEATEGGRRTRLRKRNNRRHRQTRRR